MQQKILNNRYELEQKIGEGGMARVYRGRDLRLSRRVAIKVLHSHYASDASFLSRFHHEAQAAANLHHPNIVDVYDVGQDRDIHYIV
ncbi:MAG: protein kinase, partial [Roseiflexaceae bacterium]|nr:protein kinase [Roseiflexaceae bacterium]